MTLLSLRRLVLRATRDAGARAVLFDALLTHWPASMEEVLADADAAARRRRTSFVVYLHPNMFPMRRRRGERLELEPSWFATAPRAWADRTKYRQKYGFVELYRTKDYAGPRAKCMPCGRSWPGTPAQRCPECGAIGVAT